MSSTENQRPRYQYHKLMTAKMRALVPLLCASLLCCVLGSSALHGQSDLDLDLDLNLPQMGEPADLALSPRTERLVGQQFMRKIREHLPLVQDIELNHYVQSLGRKLLATHPTINAADFHFFIVDNPEINAFAIPGGFIGINSGLIRAADNEAQLASVMAHEIAHVTQRHIARLQAAQGNTGLKTLATIVAAILIAQQSTEAGQAALLTGIAASRQSAINFTRRHEYEADRIGIQLLSQAGYNASAMTDFFEILRRRMAINAGESLEFLQTHPLTSNRISEARNNATRFDDPLAIEDSVEFQLQQAKVAVLHSDNPRQMLKSLRGDLSGFSRAARLYGQALIQLQLARPDAAAKSAAQLLEMYPDILSARLLTARAANEQGDTARAEKLLLEITDLHPDHFAAVEYYVNMLSRQRRFERARAAIVRYLRHSADPQPLIYRRYAEILRRTDQLTASYEAMAEHFFALYDTAEAIGQLRLALRAADQDSNARSRIEARLAWAHESIRAN